MERTNMKLDNSNHGNAFSWRSVLAGLVIGLFCMAAISGLGMGLGGGGLDENSSVRGALTFTGIWAVVSILCAIAVGSYFAARASQFHNIRIGSAQGLTVAALITGVAMWQAVSALGWAGRTAGDVAGSAAFAVSRGAQAASNSSAVGEVIEDSMGDLNITPERMQTVATGVASRLVNGNPEGAKNYLARQAGLTPAEADVRIAALQERANQALVTLREGTSKALVTTGWTIFLVVVLGAIVGALFGAAGARANARMPLLQDSVESDSKMTLRQFPV